MKPYCLLCCLLLVACSNFSRDIIRGNEGGLEVQQVIITNYNNDGTKASAHVQKYRYDPVAKGWIKMGPERTLPETDSFTEVADWRPYRGDPDAPPGAAGNVARHLYFLNNAGRSAVVIVNADTAEETRRIAMDGFLRAAAAAPDGLKVVVAQSSAGGTQLREVDVATNALTGRNVALPSGSNVVGLHFSPDGARLYAVDESLGVFVLQAASLQMEQTVARPAAITRIVSSVLSPDGELLLARTVGSGSLAVLEWTTRSWVSGINPPRATLLGDQPCVFHPRGGEIYCTSTQGVTVLESASLTGVANIAIPGREILFRLQANLNGDYLLVTTDRNVRLIDTRTRAIESTLAAPAPAIQFRSAIPVVLP